MTAARARAILYLSTGKTDVREAAGHSTDIPKLSVSHAWPTDENKLAAWRPAVGSITCSRQTQLVLLTERGEMP